MNYSYMIEPSMTCGSAYERLRFALVLAERNGKDIYVLSIPRITVPKAIVECGNVKMILLPRAIDFVVCGAQKEVRCIADKIYRSTGQVVGVVRVRKPYLVGIIQGEVDFARVIAQERSQHHYFAE